MVSGWGFDEFDYDEPAPCVVASGWMGDVDSDKPAGHPQIEFPESSLQLRTNGNIPWICIAIERCHAHMVCMNGLTRVLAQVVYNLLGQ